MDTFYRAFEKQPGVIPQLFYRNRDEKNSSHRSVGWCNFLFSFLGRTIIYTALLKVLGHPSKVDYGFGVSGVAPSFQFKELPMLQQTKTSPDLIRHQCLSTQMHFDKNGQKIPLNTLYMLQRVGQRHNKPYRLRMGC